MKTQYYALQSLGHFLPAMAINIDLTDEQIERFKKAGAITDKKPEKVVKNDEQAAKALNAVENATADAPNSTPKAASTTTPADTTGEEKKKSDDDQTGDDSGNNLEEAREKLEKGTRLTIPEIKLILDDDLIDYPADGKHAELMKLIPTK